MPKIPLYEQRVAPTTQIGGAEARGADLPYKALAGVGDTIAQIGFKGAEISRDRERMTAALEQKKAEAESKLLKLDIENRLSISRNAYNSELSTRNDPRNFGTEDDKSLQAMSSGINEILSDPRLRDYPELARELQISAYGTIENAKIDAQEKGIIKLHEEGKSVFDSSFDAAIDSGNAEGAIQIMQESPFHTDAEKTEMSMQVPALIQSNQIDAMTAQSPQEVIDLINEQRSGKATHWDSLDNDALRSKAAYAKQELTSRQISAAAALYDIGSTYPDMSREEKQVTIDDMRNSGAISAEVHKRESDLIKEPQEIDTTPKHITDLLSLQSKLRSAGQSGSKHGAILNEALAAGLPRNLRQQLFDTSKQILDPMSQYNRAQGSFLYDAVDAEFDKNTILPDVSGWFAPVRGMLGATVTPKNYEEYREQLASIAKYQVHENVNKWLRTDGAHATPQEIQRRVSDEVIKAKEDFKITNLQEKMDVFQGGQVSPEADDASALAEIERLRNK